jgi:hypothetical protein
MVFPGDELTRASERLPSKALMSELFPTFDRPEKTTCGWGFAGNWSTLPADMKREAF